MSRPIGIRNIIGGLTTAAIAFSLAACEDKPDVSSHVVAIDISSSAAQAQIEDLGLAEVRSKLSSLEPGSTVRVMAFDSEVGTSTCRTLDFKLEDENNQTKESDARESLIQQADSVLSEYLGCVQDEAANEDHLTDIFGAATYAASLLDNDAGEKTLSYVTDGCHTLDPEIATCTPQVEQDEWRTQAIESLPSTQVPDLDNVDVTVSGLGVGADTEQSTIEGLRRFMTEYFESTGATVTIK